jgi:hypothetical protein
MKDKIQIASYSVLLGGSIALGLIGRPTEMGLSIAAGAIGLAFANIDKISRFKGAGFEAEMRDQQIEAVIQKETEPALEGNESGFKIEAYSTDEKAQSIIRALKNSKYTWRQPVGIAKETGIDLKDVENNLNWLLENNLGQKSIGAKGAIWSLTTKGRQVFHNVA